ELEFSLRRAGKVAHRIGQGGIGAIERGGQGRTEDAESFSRRVDPDLRVYPQEIVEPGGMISMTVGDDDEIEPPQVDPQRLDVVGEDVRVVSGVEENAFAAVLNQRGESPVAGEISPRSEGVVQD